ncbi:MAG: dephospho-CoA kinase [Lachnospiraceae bacterium]|nr:dephospho-CoA kinase [Lachnospiraceae bacterium]
MKIIGITGGVGAGKSHILDYILRNYKARIIKTDEAAELLRKPGHRCYERIVELLGDTILNEDGTINRNKMAELIFSDQKKLEEINKIIHPEVNRYVAEEIKKEQENKEKDYFFIESALLIENHYDEICDELWYIDTKEEIRRERLKQNRGYSEEKISDIISKQLSEEEFKKHCQIIIDNNGEKQAVYKQIDENMGGI